MSVQRWQRGVRNLGGFAGGTSRLARPPIVLPEPDIRPGHGCPEPVITGLAYDPWEFLISGWLNDTASYIYVGDDYVNPTISQYTFPGFGFVKTVAGASAFNVGGAVAGRDGLVFTWDNPVPVGGGFEIELWRHDTADDSSTLLTTFARSSAPQPVMIYSFVDDMLYVRFDNELYQFDPADGSDTLMFDAATDSLGVDSLAARPAYTTDGVVWVTGLAGAEYGLVQIDGGTPSFVSLSASSVGDIVANGTTIYTVADGVHVKVQGGTVSVDACDFGGSNPNLGQFDADGIGIFQWFGTDIELWSWS